MMYEVDREGITVVEGVEVDLSVRDAGAGERTVDRTILELTTHCGRIAATLEHDVAPTEFDELPDKYLPPATVAWNRVLDTDTDGGRTHE